MTLVAVSVNTDSCCHALGFYFWSFRRGSQEMKYSKLTHYTLTEALLSAFFCSGKF